jgi:hypothetical protein
LGFTILITGCATNPPAPQTAELRFIDNSSNAQFVVGAVGARTVNAANLGPIPNLSLLGDPSLNSVDVIGQNDFLTPINNQGLPGPQIESHLFAVDLSDLTNLRFVGAGQPSSNGMIAYNLALRGWTLSSPFRQRRMGS